MPMLLGPTGAVALYLYKRCRSSFVPVGEERRHNLTEPPAGEATAGELPVEDNLTRWFPIWKVSLP